LKVLADVSDIGKPFDLGQYIRCWGMDAILAVNYGKGMGFVEAFDYVVANIDKIITPLKYNGGVRVKGFLTPD